ncbi:GNAT family N-acetyltransferase, partial [Klebsiella pneumoniae]|uniref:GNAT family N-acetyltransferase n=1 Tax=Klebsiella pneumoniae TaxID=573 RepID=UPI001C56D20D
ALYPFPEEKIGEMACVAVHPDYRSSSRGEVLLERIAAQARQMDEAAVFTIHGFCQRMLSLNAFESGMLFEQQLIEDESRLR